MKMDQLLRIFLYAAFVLSSYSLRITSQDENVVPYDDYNGYGAEIYPRELIQELVDALTPEQLEALKIESDPIGHREGDTSSEYCDWYDHISTPHILPADDGYATAYFIANITKDYIQTFPVQVCKQTINGIRHEKCHNKGYRTPSISGCCINEDKVIPMHVVSTSVEDYIKSSFADRLILKSQIVIKNMTLETSCKCRTVVLEPFSETDKCDKRVMTFIKASN